MRSTAIFPLSILVLGACGCNSILAPEKPSTTAATSPVARPYEMTSWDTPSQGQVPVLSDITTEVEGDLWVLRAVLIPRDPDPFYSVSQAGAYSLQILFNTDQQSTGYSDGYEYETGWWADEVEPFVIRGPIPECCDWGEVSGYAGMQIIRNRITIRVPISALRDDGALNWQVATLSTVECAECPSGVTAEFSDQYRGATELPTVVAGGQTLANVRRRAFIP